MFTGIIKDIGSVASISRRGNGLRLAIKTTSPDFSDLQIDESISISGACQTVVSVNQNIFEVDTVEETLKKTTLGSWRVGDGVNLERALRASDRLGGHIVQGHVDGVGEILSLEELAGSWSLHISFEPRFAPFIVPIGSIAVDGVSLTVADILDNTFKVAIIPYTFTHTTLGERKRGEKVNLEFDILGKYLARQVQVFTAPQAQPLTEARLKDLGY